MKYNNVDLSDKEYLWLIRFMYRIGSPITDDGTYDNLMSKYKDDPEFAEFSERTYDDDPIPYDVLSRVNLTNLIPEFGSSSPYAEALDEDKTLSIKAVVSTQGVWDFIKNNPDEDFLASIKYDGDSFKGVVAEQSTQVLLSRARKAVNAIDYTHGMIKVFPKEINFNSDLVKVYGEVFADTNGLEHLRKNYNKDFVTCKSSALSIIRDYRVFKEEDFKYLKYKVFNLEGAGEFESKSSMLDYVDSLGLDTPCRMRIPREYIPTDRAVFDNWIILVLEKLKEMSGNDPSDGLVLEVDNLKSDFNIKEQYSNRNIAIKFGPWEYTKYTGIVEDIIVKQKSMNCSVVIKIKPHRADDNCELKRVTGYNFSIIRDLGIDVGSEIQFERSAGTYSTLIYKK